MLGVVHLCLEANRASQGLGYIRASALLVLPRPQATGNADGLQLPEPSTIMLILTDSLLSQAKPGEGVTEAAQHSIGTLPRAMLSKAFSIIRTSQAASGAGKDVKVHNISLFFTGNTFYHPEAFIIIAWVHLIKFINLSLGQKSTGQPQS